MYLRLPLVGSRSAGDTSVDANNVPLAASGRGGKSRNQKCYLNTLRGSFLWAARLPSVSQRHLSQSGSEISRIMRVMSPKRAFLFSVSLTLNVTYKEMTDDIYYWLRQELIRGIPTPSRKPRLHGPTSISVGER